METVYVKNYFEAMERLFEDSFDDSIDRIRSSYVFRGMCNSNYRLESSIRRNCKHKTELEKPILRNFSKYAILDKPELYNSVWLQLIIGQHHGLPTRLLDWSYSPLVALHFATDDKDLATLDKNDAVVWKVNLKEINDLMPQKYKQERINNNSYVLTVDMLEKIVSDLDTYDQDMGIKAFAFLEPPSIDARIINQYALFSIIPNSLSALDDMLAIMTNKTTKIVIDKNAKWSIRDTLDQMNMNERICYPGLDGLALWLKRHYYVNI